MIDDPNQPPQLQQPQAPEHTSDWLAEPSDPFAQPREPKQLLVAGTAPLRGIVSDFFGKKSGTEQMVEKGRMRKVPDMPEEQADEFLRGADDATKQKFAERGWNFDLNRFEAPEDVIDVLRQTSETVDNPNQAIPWEQTKAAASKLAQTGGMNEDAVIAWSRKQGLNATQIQLASEMLMDSSTRVRDAVEFVTRAKEAGSLTNADRLAFRQLLGRHAALQQTYSGMAAEAGRTLNILRSSAAGGGHLYANQINDTLALMGGPEVTDKLIDALADMDNMAAMNRLVRSAHNAKTPDMIHELWLNGLLSAPSTHLVNFGSSGAATVYLNAERLLTGAIGDLKGGFAKLFRQNVNPDSASTAEAMPHLYGEMMGLFDGIRLMGKALRSGESAIDPLTKLRHAEEMGAIRSGGNPATTSNNIAAKLQRPTGGLVKPGNGALAKGLDHWLDYSPVAGRLPTRLLVAEDDFWKAINYRGEAHALIFREAKKIAREAGKADDTEFVAKTIAKLTDDMPPQIHEQALAKAREATFTDKPAGGWGSLEKFAQGTRHIPVLGRYIVPFVRTPINILKFTVQRTPLGLMDSSVRNDLLAGGARQEAAMAKIALGTGVMSAGFMVADSGLTTGGGPPKSKQGLREADARLGIQNRSLRVPAGFFGENDPPKDTYYAINRMDPIGMFLTLPADVREIMDWIDDDATMGEFTSDVLIAMSEQFSDKSYLQGVADAVDAVVSDPKRYFKQWIHGMAGSFVPNVVAHVNKQYFDNTRREVDSVLDAWRARIPGLSQNLPPVDDLWGFRQESPEFSMWTSFQKSTLKETPATPLDWEIKNNQWNIERPDRYMNGFDLRSFEVEVDGKRRSAYERYLELQGQIVTDGRGNNLVDSLLELIDNPEYQKLPPGPDSLRLAPFRNIIEAYRQQARVQLLEDFPELADKIQAADNKVRDAQGLPPLNF